MLVLTRQETPGAGEPMLANALIIVREAEGSQHTSQSDDDGFYTVSVGGPGPISITASKDGYETRVLRFALLNDTVLNFSPMPA